MTLGDLTIACAPSVVVGGDLAVRAERHTDPVAAVWTLCVSTDRLSIRLGEVSPRALECRLDDRGVLRLSFPSAVRTIDLTIESGDVGESEWTFWVDDAADDDRPRRRPDA